MIKAVFFDIDGTLVSFQTHSIPQSTIDSINKLRLNNIKVILATARFLNQIDNLDDLQFDGFITVNGAYCVTTDEQILAKRLIPNIDLQRLIDYEKDDVGFSYAFITEEGTFVNRVDDNVRSISELLNVPVPQVVDLRECLDRSEVFQLKLYVDRSTETRLMNASILPNCVSSRWHPLFANVNVAQANKSIGINDFLNYYNLQQSETMAFGDGGNDIEMLKHVAIGVAMGNATDDVKQIADYVTDSVDDNGVANALLHFKIIN